MWPVVFRCGGRIWKFLLTHPVWDVTKVQGITGTNSKFLLTHPVWDVTCVPNFGTFLMRISTHTSRVGCDPLATAALKLLIHFYSHIPCGMWHFTTFHEWLYSKNFYSHIPCGMWRSAVPYSLIGMKFLLTHPVWDVTQVSGTVYDIYEISTHTSRVGCDLHAQEKIRNISSFLLTHPVWDVTQNPTVFLIWQKNFYSHIPCGMWQTIHYGVMVVFRFLLTHPVWDVTGYHGNNRRQNRFLLTHPVWDVTLQSGGAKALV